MTEPIKETILAPHVFTPSETEQLGKQLGREYSKRAEILKQKKSFASQYKAKEDESEAIIAVLADKLNSGEEMRPVLALVTFDTARKMKLFSDDAGALIREEPMVASDWELPLFKEDASDVVIHAGNAQAIITNADAIISALDLLPQGFAVVAEGRSQEGDIALNVERTAWVNVASPGANWDEYHGLARRMDAEVVTEPTPDPESPVGETNLGDKLDAAAAEWPAAKLHFPTGEVPHPNKNGSSFVREFRAAASAAGWSVIQTEAMVGILRKCDGVKAMQETLAPHTYDETNSGDFQE